MLAKRPLSLQKMPTDAKRVFRGELFEVYQWKQKLFDGSEVIFEKLKRPDTAYVVPVTSSNELVLVEQIQPGREPFIGLIGGRIEVGETPEEGARRELLEEAGLEAGSLTLWESFQFLPKIDWAVYCFIAKDCTAALKKSFDQGEKIRLIRVTFTDFVDLVSQDRFTDVEIALRVLRATHNSRKLDELKQMFIG